MKVGLYDLRDQNGKDLAVQQAYEQILAHNGIQSVRLRVEEEGFWDQVRTLSLFIMRFQHYDASLQLARDILPVVEGELKIPCYPNRATAWHYDDKIKQYFLIKAHGFPITKSWIFYDRDKALRWARTARYPLVFKLRAGAGSMNVILVESPGHASQLIRRAFGSGLIPQRSFTPGLVRFRHFDPAVEIRHLLGNLKRRLQGLDPHHFWIRHKNYALFQQFLPGNDFDTRIAVIGGRAFGFRRMVRSGDFRASGSGLLDYDTGAIDPRCVEIALKVSREMGFQSMAYDFLFNQKGKPEFCEISYTYVSRAVYDCPGYWDRGLNWHPGHFWPEYLHLVDGLGDPDLKMPPLDY